MVLLMSVNPGFGGQDFIRGSLKKIRALKEEITKRGLSVEIEIDGGITVDNAGEVIRAGTDILVAGSAVFKSSDYKETISRLRKG